MKQISILRKQEKDDIRVFFKLSKYYLSSFFTKKITYAFFIIYILLITSVTIIVPSTTEIWSFEIISNYYFLITLFILNSIIGIVFAIEIFRTSIDDGTELIIVSKSINRKNIFLSKYIVFLLSITLLSIVISITSCLCFLDNKSTFFQQKNIVLGMLVGNFLVFIFFGSIAILISLFFNRTLSLVINVAIVMILAIFGISNSFTGESAIKKARLKDNNFNIVSLLDFSDKNRINKTNIGNIIDYQYEPYSNPNQLLENCNDNIFNEFIEKVNLVNQFIVPYTFNQPADNIPYFFQLLDNNYYPIKFNYSHFDFYNYSDKIAIKYFDEKTEKETNNFLFPSIQYIGSFLSLENKIDYHIYDQIIYTWTNEINSNNWINAWNENKYIVEIDQDDDKDDDDDDDSDDDSKRNNIQKSEITTASQFIENYISNNQYLDLKKILINISQLAISGFYHLVNLNQTIDISNITNEQKIILELNSININVDNSISDKNNIEFKYFNDKYMYDPMINLSKVDENFLTYSKIDIRYIYNFESIIALYVILSLIIIAVAFVINSKKNYK